MYLPGCLPQPLTVAKGYQKIYERAATYFEEGKVGKYADGWMQETDGTENMLEIAVPFCVKGTRTKRAYTDGELKRATPTGYPDLVLMRMPEDETENLPGAMRPFAYPDAAGKAEEIIASATGKYAEMPSTSPVPIWDYPRFVAESRKRCGKKKKNTILKA